MFKIVEAYPLTDITVYMKIEAPDVARKAGPGQFVILRADETGERVPFTISDADPDAGTVSIIFQKVGLTTLKLGERKAGDTIADFVGPLGNVSDLDGYRSACVIGGGLGCAIALPQAKYLRGRGAR
ncbi:MAG: sulfide/dihydroorotate dehydrogenase-like FAD/NAD-binding protein, partial [Clostridiales bacterium]|nr:sulfide/dihydroorotate dehydrogenase-like FAD/NAD-binding protein [Clostridiales bacterium]